jgi:putative hydrolase of the HAD superfamily
LKKYQHLFFDLDHTLWDFDKNTGEAIEEIYHLFNFGKWKFFNLQELLQIFQEVNNYLWDRFNKGLIDRLELRNIRFPLILEKLGVNREEIPEGIGLKYLEIAPKKSGVISHAHEVLEELSKRYRLHIITNGFDDVQHTKMRSSGLDTYFDEIVTSDSAGSRKPKKEIFEYALACVGGDSMDSIMIGDNIETDIVGAMNANLDNVFFNPFGQKHDHSVTYEIDNLRQLTSIF